MMDTYTTVFDVSRDSFRYWWLGILFIAVILTDLAFFIVIRVNRSKGRSESRQNISLVSLLLVFVTLVSGCLFFGPLTGYYLARYDLAHGDASFVEGKVADFDPMPYEGHKDERFTEDGVEFKYSDFTITPAFNSAFSHGGPICEGLPVKIWYKDGSIWKLQVASH